eukprot:4023448-Prymnesium_polylepis.1
MARKLTAETTESIRATGRAHALARKFGRRWRARVLAGGLERIAALVHIDDVRHRGLALIPARIPAAGWRRAVNRLKTAVASEVAIIRLRHTRHRRNLATAWKLGWRCLRWRADAARQKLLDELAVAKMMKRGRQRGCRLMEARRTEQLRNARSNAVYPFTPEPRSYDKRA